ncbi:MAG: amidohydrolase family protein [Candidatus Tenebribacter davisii]|jgi:cytosine/adenosine deaminase-related metal-dependent hydrolase|nr:amidohydrolase family protein [Candidatus Tenebribacter davisii]
MKIKVNSCVCDSENISSDTIIRVNSKILKSNSKLFDRTKSIAYPPFINSHDHLISNWYPKAGFGRTYPNVNIWVEDMKGTDSFLERNKVWINDGAFDLTEPAAAQIVLLGIYKNLFSGCAVVQDHIPKQKSSYYNNNLINVIKDYTQYHSLSLGNWWGGDSAEAEYAKTKSQIPFIIHLGEGIDNLAEQEFPKLKELNLLKSNTLLIHGISLSREQIKECAEAGTSICWCPNSNYYLIGETLDIYACMEYGVNVVLGTDSTMSGSINLLEEIKFAHQKFPHIPMQHIFEMFTTNAAKALRLPKEYGAINDSTSDLLLIKKHDQDPFRNLLQTGMDDIELMIHKGIPIYGDVEFLDEFIINEDDYYFFGKDRFVLGHPEKIISAFNKKLGYEKGFPFLPF